MARLIVLTVPLFFATSAASTRLRHGLWTDLARPAAPLAGLGAGLGLAQPLGGAADYVSAALLAGAAAFLLASQGEWALIAFAIGCGIGLLDPPPVAAVIMVGVQAVVGTAISFALPQRRDARVRGVERLSGAVLAAIAIYLFFARAAG